MQLGALSVFMEAKHNKSSVPDEMLSKNDLDPNPTSLIIRRIVANFGFRGASGNINNNN